MIRALVVPASMDDQLQVVEIGKEDLDAYRRLVGGNIELVNLNRPPASLYLNEDGKNLDLPVNQRAVCLVWAHNSAFRNHDVMVGDAFIVGPADGRGYDTDVPAELVSLTMTPGGIYRYQVQTSGNPAWNGNGMVFDDWFAAYVDGLDLADRWSLVDEVRVIRDPSDNEREQWYRVGVDNPWIAKAVDPPFKRSSFVGCYTIEELQDRLTEVSWGIGTAFYFMDLCLIQQVEAGDEWLAIRHGIPFESITFGPSIERGEFPDLIRRLLAATKQQCQELTY